MHHKAYRLGSGRGSSVEAGFSLIEILVTVVIITIIAAIAMPVLRDGMQERRTRHTAEEVARVFRDARLRAVGRGSAVLVHYDNAKRTFELREAIAGPGPNASATCKQLPATSCQLAQWIDNSQDLVLGNQLLETYRYENQATEVTGMKVYLELPGAPGTPVVDFAVCFTPLGRAYTSVGTWPPVFTAMTYAPEFRVYRTQPGEVTRLGLERRVVLLPNGQARIQTSG